jgi:hypothetical protein
MYTLQHYWRTGSAWKGGVRREKEGLVGEGEGMAQTMYAYMNK